MKIRRERGCDGFDKRTHKSTAEMDERTDGLGNGQNGQMN